MFFSEQTPKQREEYVEYLKTIGRLSNLFSSSDIPYLYYRIAEKVFCRAFNADDLSRSDVSADAKKGTLGIGLKTFLAGNNKTYQKVAEFNTDRLLYSDLEHKETELVKRISELRNKRIEFTETTHALTNSIYHCIIREAGKFKIFEESLDKIDIPNIQKVKKNNGSITFEDGKHQYGFLLSKSTLTKRFITNNIINEFAVDILTDPLEKLNELFTEKNIVFEKESKIKETVYLPLYSENFIVMPKSGLNQRNAGGRKRNESEVYIQVPAAIHKKYPHFFPNRDIPFSLRLPNNKEMRSKICQEGGKALMSYSNKELGQWLLRDVLQLKPGELLTYERLQILGPDSVRIAKINDLEFEINFSKIGSYEEFKNNFLS